MKVRWIFREFGSNGKNHEGMKGKTLGLSSFNAYALEKNALLLYRETGRNAVTVITIVLSNAQLEETEVCELNDSSYMKFWTF